jgi:hypothetical protein
MLAYNTCRSVAVQNGNHDTTDEARLNRDSHRWQDMTLDEHDMNQKMSSQLDRITLMPSRSVAGRRGVALRRWRR